MAALKDGFLPDIISADNASNSFCLDYYAKNLPFVMSKYLALGMTLEQVVACVTQNPAKLLSMEGKIGTLAPGAFADIAVMKLCRKEQVDMPIVHAAYHVLYENGDAKETVHQLLTRSKKAESEDLGW